MAGYVSSLKIVYPAIDDWLLDNELSIVKFAKLAGLSHIGLYNILIGKIQSPGKIAIDAILKTTGMTYEEAFREGKSV